MQIKTFAKEETMGRHPKKAVLFLYGFPELWYSWHHQMLHLSTKGYRTIAPDLRGYGDTDTDALTLGLGQVFLMGHDWGAIVAWWFCLLRSDRIRALTAAWLFSLEICSSKPFRVIETETCLVTVSICVYSR
ncbi:hypothetical protein DH2020_010827 [Rehmannia glutinosa]|uniref:AB hydrolase-1 domain-containing protein n=1 Tax=Rehmannia glutinosa TaxID=99300 RepID=A0ABR0XBP4_REHGL